MQNLVLVIIYSLVLLHGIEARAVDLIGNLTVSGSRLSIPEWQDVNSNVITSLTYDFTGVADNDPGQHVLSNTHELKLVDPNDPGGPKSIKLNRPKDCSIGLTNINDSHVRFVIDGTVYGNNTITFTEGILYTSQMRFNRNGDYADKLGVVTCATSGLITFLY